MRMGSVLTCSVMTSPPLGANVNREGLEYTEEAPLKTAAKGASGWKKKQTPLIAACCKGHRGIVKLLLANNANPNQQLTRTSSTSSSNQGTPAVAAGGGGGGTAPGKRIKAQASSFNARPPSSATPASSAPSQGSIAASTNTTPLLAALSHGHLEIVELLLKAGAAGNQGDDSTTPLCAALAHGHFPIAELLLKKKKADPNKPRARDGTTPLLIALVSFNSAVRKKDPILESVRVCCAILRVCC